MHAWASIQQTLDYIEAHLNDTLEMDKLAGIAALSPFYFQSLFSRLVKKSVREYIKLRRLAHTMMPLTFSDTSITDIAINWGFNNRETFARAFKETYGMWPTQYRKMPVSLIHFDKPNLLYNYVMVDEGMPLLSEGIVLEYNRKILDADVHFVGVQDYCRFKQGKMLGERPGVSEPGEIWGRFFKQRRDILSIPNARTLGVSFKGDAQEGYSTYFAGIEVSEDDINHTLGVNASLVQWVLPAREYIVCAYEAENMSALFASMGKMMKFTRTWLKSHNLISDGFFPELYFHEPRDHAYMEMWIPFKERKNKKNQEASQ